jgi:hypothetical protein
MLLVILAMTSTPALAKSLFNCVTDWAKAKTQNSSHDYQSFAMKAADLNNTARNLEAHFSDVRQDFVGGGGRPFALQGLPPHFEAPQLFIGKVVRASDVQNVFKNGLISADSGGEVWTTKVAADALEYAIKRGSEWKSNNPDDKWVIVVVRIDASKLDSGISFSPHVRSQENRGAFYTRQDIPSSAVSHVFVLDPTATTGNTRFQTVPNPALSSQ